MAPLKIALVGVLGIGLAASLAFADHKPNHPGGTTSGVWVFAGYTSATMVGGATRPAMYDACQFDFDSAGFLALGPFACYIRKKQKAPEGLL